MASVGGGSAEQDEVAGAIPPGQYLLAMVWFKRSESQAGNTYLRARFVVCAGPRKGAGFFAPWSVDVSRAGIRKRWEVWLEQLGCNQEIDLDNDAQIARLCKGRPFKAEVTKRLHNGYENNDIGRLIYPRLYTKLDQADMAAWNEEWDQRGWQHRDPSDPGPLGDDKAPPTVDTEPQWTPGMGMGDDDDCPF